MVTERPTPPHLTRGQQPTQAQTPANAAGSQSVDLAVERPAQPTRAAVFEFSVSAPLDGASDSAKRHFRDCIQRYAEELSHEASLLEVGSRSRAVSEPDITPTMIVEASNSVPRRLFQKQVDAGRSKADLAAQIIAPLSASASGVLGSYLDSQWQVSLFTAAALIAVFSTIYCVYKAWKGRA